MAATADEKLAQFWNIGAPQWGNLHPGGHAPGCYSRAAVGNLHFRHENVADWKLNFSSGARGRRRQASLHRVLLLPLKLSTVRHGNGGPGAS